MGRPKLYEDKAEKMRAYRARRAGRVVVIDRDRVESMDDRLRELRAAVVAAQDAGSREAQDIDTITLEDTIDGVISHFQRLRSVEIHRRVSKPQEVASVAVSSPSKEVVAARNSFPMKSNVTLPEPELKVKHTLPNKGRGRAW